ncbi:MAG TPA: hypothetical protein VND93_10405 [Myxococcales bacterium]|nr:hypothetical protein [Myxococcales bacterium]
MDARPVRVLLAVTALTVSPVARAGDTGGEGLLPPRRYGYVAGGAFALAGLGFGIVAGAEAARAQSSTSARETTQALGASRDHAATANLCYAMAGASVLYALALEFLPRPAADAASLSFRF